MRRQLPIMLAFLAGMLLWVQFYVPSQPSNALLTRFTQSWAVILVSAAFLLGVLSAIQHHWGKIKLKKAGFAYSLITLIAFAITIVFGIAPLAMPGFTGVQNQPGSFFSWIFDNIQVPLDATMFSLLAFFIASAAFRAFRARSFEATALLLAGCFVMIGRVPLGEILPIFWTPWTGTDYLDTFAGWIMNVPNTAAQRGIMLGVIISQIAISLRIIFGIERTYMGGGD